MFPTEYLKIYAPHKRMVSCTQAFYRGFYQPLVHRLTGEYHFITRPSLSEYILLVGSYKHCAFLLKHLHGMRSSGKGISYWTTTSAQSSSIKIEDGTPKWLHCRLTSREYFCLLLGNLVRDREDRRQLWDLIRAQTSNGHPKHMFYLRLALRHGNNLALTQLLDLGWQVNGPFWAMFMTPLGLSTFLEIQAAKKKSDVLRHYSFDGWKKPRWGDLVSHKGVFKMYQKSQSQLHENFEELTKQNSETLRSYGGKLPWVVSSLRNEKVMLWTWLCVSLFYGLVLPLTVAHKTGHMWKWKISNDHKVVWVFEWSVTVLLTLLWLRCSKGVRFFTSAEIVISVLMVIQLILQHLVPWILILSLKHPGDWLLAALIPFSVMIVEGCVWLTFMGIIFFFIFSMVLLTNSVLFFFETLWYLLQYFTYKIRRLVKKLLRVRSE